MPKNWNELHRYIVRCTKTKRAEMQFGKIVDIYPELSRFQSLEYLVNYLQKKQYSLTERTKLYAVFIEAAQKQNRVEQLAVSLLWIGLWSGLDHIYKSWAPRFVDEQDELISLISSFFTILISKIDLDKVDSIAGYLIKSTHKNLCVHWDRERKYATRFVITKSPDDAQEIISVFQKKYTSLLGLPSQRPIDAQIQSIHCWLQAAVGGDNADLVVGKVILHHSESEMARHLNISVSAACKRFKRTLKILKKKCSNAQNNHPFLASSSLFFEVSKRSHS